MCTVVKCLINTSASTSHWQPIAVTEQRRGTEITLYCPHRTRERINTAGTHDRSAPATSMLFKSICISCKSQLLRRHWRADSHVTNCDKKLPQIPYCPHMSGPPRGKRTTAAHSGVTKDLSTSTLMKFAHWFSTNSLTYWHPSSNCTPNHSSEETRPPNCFWTNQEPDTSHCSNQTLAPLNNRSGGRCINLSDQALTRISKLHWLKNKVNSTYVPWNKKAPQFFSWNPF